MKGQSVRCRRQGFVFVATLVWLSIGVTLLTILGTGFRAYMSSTDVNRRHITAVAENRRILYRIKTEVAAISTERDQPEEIAPSLPWQDPSPGESHPAYSWPRVAIDQLQDTDARDGIESWRGPSNLRRFFIYSTYTNFDTLEYQRVMLPTTAPAMVDFFDGVGEIREPWTPPRKIFLESGRVLLRALDEAGGVETFVLGSGVSALAFHVDERGHILIRLTTGGGGTDEVEVSSEVVVAPLN